MPDYERCRNFFKAGLKRRRYPTDGKIDFSLKSPAKKVGKPLTPKNGKSTPKRKSKEIEPSEDDEEGNGDDRKLAKPSAGKRTVRKRVLKMSSSDDETIDESPPMKSRPAKKKAPKKATATSKPAYKDTGSQTSPAFVKKAKELALRKKANDSIAKKKKAAKRKSTTEEDDDEESENGGMANPTAAMLEIMAKKKAKESVKKRKK